MKNSILLFLLLSFTSGKSQIDSAYYSNIDTISIISERGISPRRISNIQGFNLDLLKLKRVHQATVVSSLIGYSLTMNLDTFGRITSIKTTYLPGDDFEFFSFMYSDTSEESLTHILYKKSWETNVYRRLVDTVKNHTDMPETKSRYKYSRYLRKCYYSDDGLIHTSIDYEKRYLIFKQLLVTRMYFYSYYP